MMRECPQTSGVPAACPASAWWVFLAGLLEQKICDGVAHSFNMALPP